MTSADGEFEFKDGAQITVRDGENPEWVGVLRDVQPTEHGFRGWIERADDGGSEG